MTVKYQIDRKNLAKMGWSQPNMETFSQLASFARTREELEQAQEDITTAQTDITTLKADFTALEEEVGGIPLLIDPAPPLSLEAGDVTGALGYTPANVAGDTFTGDVTAPEFIGPLTGNVTGDVTGNADTATLATAAETLLTSRSISTTGDATWTVNFDGSANVSAALTLATVNANVGSFTNASITVDAKGRITAASSGTVGIGIQSGYWSPLTDGDGASPELIFTADGDVIAVWTET